MPTRGPQSIDEVAIRELLEFLLGTHDLIDWVISLPPDKLQEFEQFLRSKPCVIHPDSHKKEIALGDIREMLDVMQGMCEGLIYMGSETATGMNIFMQLSHK